MYRIHDITEYDDLDCALASAKIIKIDSGKRHTVAVETPDPSLFYIADYDEYGHVHLFEHEASYV